MMISVCVARCCVKYFAIFHIPRQSIGRILYVKEKKSRMKGIRAKITSSVVKINFGNYLSSSWIQQNAEEIEPSVFI